MNDHELSSLLQEWKRTPAPPTLDARVFTNRQSVTPRWWDRVPAPITALSGVAVGGLVVFGLTTLLSPHAVQSVTPPAPPPVVSEEPVTRPPAPATTRKAMPKPPKVVRPAPFVAPVPTEAFPRPKAAPRRPAVAGSAPVPVYAPSAVFPPSAQGLTTTTKVKIRIKIDKDGHVIEAAVIEGDPLLDDAAIETVMGWTFRPYTLNGIPADMASEVTVDFTSGAPKPKKIAR